MGHWQITFSLLTHQLYLMVASFLCSYLMSMFLLSMTNQAIVRKSLIVDWSIHVAILSIKLIAYEKWNGFITSSSCFCRESVLASTSSLSFNCNSLIFYQMKKLSNQCRECDHHKRESLFTSWASSSVARRSFSLASAPISSARARACFSSSWSDPPYAHWSSDSESNAVALSKGSTDWPSSWTLSRNLQNFSTTWDTAIPLERQ